MQVHRQLDALPDFRKPVVTIGSFDGVHLGHQQLVQRVKDTARGIGGESVVVTFDPHPRLLLQTDGPPLRLLNTLPEKIDRLRSLEVDHLVVTPFTREFARQSADEYLNNFLFGQLHPHTVLIGYDHRFGAGRTGDINLLRRRAAERGIEIDEIEARDVENLAVSSTRIRSAIEAGELLKAGELLGQPYPLSGRVVRGQALGRTIGFPTANLDINDPYKLLPADGVYAARVHLSAYPEALPAMLYIGERPSLHENRPRSIEVNILDFEGDLYGQLMEVDVLCRLRSEQAFDSLEALRLQLERDREATRRYFEQSA